MNYVSGFQSNELAAGLRRSGCNNLAWSIMAF
jgi:hypothetical protein